MTECHIATMAWQHQPARPTRHPHDATGHSSLDVGCLFVILSVGAHQHPELGSQTEDSVSSLNGEASTRFLDYFDACLPQSQS